jgi:Right handed beta helix region
MTPSMSPSPSPSPSEPPQGGRGLQPGIVCPLNATRVTTTVQAALNSESSGGTVCVPARTWTVSSSLTFKTGQTLMGEYGAVISGGGTATRATSVSVAGVTLRTLTFRDFNAGYRNANVIIGSGWLVENVQLTDNAGVGISAVDSTAAVIRDSIIDHNSQVGLAAYRSIDHLVQNNEIAFNNTGLFDGGSRLVAASGSEHQA